MSKLLQKLLIASSILALAGIAQAQDAAVARPAGSDAVTAAPDNPAASAANDPYVKRREEKKAAKEEYKARTKAAKADYKAEKKEANAELKASGSTAASNNSDLYPNNLNNNNSSGK